MKKEEKIKEAWEILIGKIGCSIRKDKIDENGYLQYETPNNLSVLHELCEKHPSRSDWEKWRPKSLQGIEEYYSFVDIKGFENYQVNKQGIVVSKSRVSLQKNGKKYTVKEKIMRPQIDNTGYIVFGLRNNKKETKKVYLHRILAECFIINNENKPCVNHKDGVKYNNSLSNLEWCTYKENNVHAFETGLQKKGKDHHFYNKKGIECHNHKEYQPIEKPLKPIY